MATMSPNTPPPRRDLGPEWSDDENQLTPEPQPGVEPAEREHIEPEAPGPEDLVFEGFEELNHEPQGYATGADRRSLPDEPSLVARRPLEAEEEPARDMGRYWPLFVVGGALAVLLGWWLLGGMGQTEGEPVAPGPTATQTVPGPTETVTEPSPTETETVTAPAPEPAPTETAGPAPAPTDAAPTTEPGADPAPTSQAPAPEPDQGADLSDAEGAFDGAPTPPQQVASAELLGADGDVVLYDDPEYGPVSVRFDKDMDDTGVAARFGQGVILVEDWVCGSEGASFTCIGKAHGGRVMVTADAQPEQVAGWGKALVAAWPATAEV